MEIEHPAAYLRIRGHIDAWLPPAEVGGFTCVRFITVDRRGDTWTVGLVRALRGQYGDDVYALEDVDPDVILAGEKQLASAEDAIAYAHQLAGVDTPSYVSTATLQRLHDELAETLE